jgi:hypothetical protein
MFPFILLIKKLCKSLIERPKKMMSRPISW